MFRTIVSTLALACAAALGCVSLAGAADMPVKQAARTAYAAEAASWSGCYIGAHTGYALGHSKIDAMGGGSLASFDEKGWIAGGQFGCDVQAGQHVVVGIGADGTYLGGVKDSVSGVQSQFNWMGTVYARAGLLLTNDWLLYGKGGLAFAKTGLSSGGFSTDDVRLGFAIGAGTEYRISRNWSWVLGYEYVDLGRNTQLIVLSQKSDLHKFTTGLNFRF
jgi:outer membrane immunogenic protein